MIVSFDGHAPDVHPAAFVHEAAWVIGRVRLSAGCTVWPGAVLRGDMDEIKVGKNTNIQDGVVVHADSGLPVVLGEGVTVGHAAVLHSCTVKSHSLIGIGARVLNQSVIGGEALVGAGAVVAPGAEVPDGSLALGVPARVLRPVTPEEKKHIRLSAERYASLAEKYRKTRAAGQ